MHPIFIRIGPLDIHTYGVLVAIGFIVGLAVAGRRARSEGIPAEQSSDLGPSQDGPHWLGVSLAGSGRRIRDGESAGPAQRITCEHHPQQARHRQ